ASTFGRETDDRAALIVRICIPPDVTVRLDLGDQLAHRLARNAHAAGQPRHARAAGVEVSEKTGEGGLHAVVTACLHAPDRLVVHLLKGAEELPQEQSFPAFANLLVARAHDVNLLDKE